MQLASVKTRTEVATKLARLFVLRSAGLLHVPAATDARLQPVNHDSAAALGARSNQWCSLDFGAAQEKPWVARPA